MSARRDLFERIATALERIAPSVAPPVDWASAPAFIWTGETALPVDNLDAVPIEKLCGIEAQKQAVRTNLQRLAKGAAAHDMLLWGARGMGKSALIRAAVAEVGHVGSEALALVQLAPEALSTAPELLSILARQTRPTLLFLDDLGFGPDQAQDNLALRSLLDGGVMPRPAHIRLAVTSNRRAIISRDAQEDDILHERDERDDALALADRFGLKLGFHPCDRETYLEILRAYTAPLELLFDEDEALAWAIARGNRSGRSAYQFACELAGRAGKPL